MRITSVVRGVVVGVTLAILSGCGGARSASKAGDPPPPALLAASDVARVSRTDLAAGVPVSGTLTPGVDIKITAPLDEVIEAVMVREGYAVRRGQVLARLRTAALQPAALSAAAALKIATADFERQQNLLREGAVAERDVEGAEAGLRVAEANEAQARKRLEDATVRAPVAGVIAARSVQGGDRVAVGDPMFQLVNTAELEFEATVPSEFVQYVGVGSPVNLRVSGFPAGGVTGRVARVNATADPATRQVKVYVTVANREGKLVGGLFASGSVVTKEAKRALAVPSAAVRADGAQSFVLVIAGGRLERREVTTGVRDDGRDLVEVLSGLAEGDTTVVGPIEGLSPGQPAQVAGKAG
jgi:membrane fusion protein (multidrug efflux system)